MNEQKVIANTRKLFDWVHSLNEMDRILLNRIESLESKIEKLESKKLMKSNEEKLVSIIDNFILWYTSESDEGLAREYVGTEEKDYIDDLFK